MIDTDCTGSCEPNYHTIMTAPKANEGQELLYKYVLLYFCFCFFLFKEQKVSNLCKFVEYLTLKLHEALPESLVIWYDSVITTGELKWQDQLNDRNR